MCFPPMLLHDGPSEANAWNLTGVDTRALNPGERSSYGVEIAPQLNAPNDQDVFAAGIQNPRAALNRQRSLSRTGFLLRPALVKTFTE
jgi:hypothetical protein